MTGASSSAQGLRIHALVFVIVMIANVVINLLTGPPWWFLWVLLGWGIGLAAHWWFTRGVRSTGGLRD